MPDVQLSWSLSPTAASKVDGQRVYRSSTSSPTFPGDYTQIASVGDSQTTYTDTGVAEGQTFTYAVTAFNSAGESSETTTSVVTPIAEARIDKAGTTLKVPIYDPSTITDDWLRVRVNDTVGVLKPISKSGEPLRVRTPSDTIVGVKIKQL